MLITWQAGLNGIIIGEAANPGPHRGDGEGEALHLDVICCNVNGKNNMWVATAEYLGKDVLLFQELNMTQRNFDAYAQCQRERGYHVFWKKAEGSEWVRAAILVNQMKQPWKIARPA